MIWVPKWADYYSITQTSGQSIVIDFYTSESAPVNVLIDPISKLDKDLAIYDVCQQIRERNEPKRSKYHREIKPGVWIDIYDILRAYGIKCHALAHAIKKLLMPGDRGHKDYNQDCEEAIQSIRRSIDEHV